MKTILKLSLSAAFLIMMSFLSRNLTAQAPPLPLEIARCQDFFGSVERGDLNAVKRCLNKKPEFINKRTPNDETPLMIASETCNAKMVAYLLKGGALVENENIYGERAIHLAAKAGNLQTLTELVDYGAQIEIKTYQGDSPLHYAAGSGNFEIVKYLEKAGANIFELGVNQSNLILWAAKGGNIELFEYLEKKNLDIHTIDAEGNGVLHWAAMGSNPAMCQFLIKEKGFDIRQRNLHGNIPIEVGIKFRQFETTKYFLDNGIGIHETNASGGTWLHNAACCGSTLIGNYLLQRGCNMNTIDKNGLTPLNLAIASCHLPLVKLLMEYGAEGKREML